MKTFTKVTILVFRLFLFSILGYMIVEQVTHFIRNDDVSSMRYNKFSSHREDIYPTFSICIASYRGGLFKDDLGVNRAEVYTTYLQGKLKETGLNNDYNISELECDMLGPGNSIGGYIKSGIRSHLKQCPRCGRGRRSCC